MAAFLDEQYADDFTAQVKAGSIAVLTITDDEITHPADAEGRVFEQRVFDPHTPDNEVLATATAEVLIDGEGVTCLQFTLTAEQTDALLPAGVRARDLRHCVVEVKADGDVDLITPRDDPVFRVRRSGERG